MVFQDPFPTKLIPRPVPYEIDLQESTWFIELCQNFGFPLVETSSIVVKLSYCFLFSIVVFDCSANAIYFI